MPYVTAGVLVGSALYNAISAGSRKRKAEKGLKALANKRPQYATLEEAEAMIKEGYSAEEKSAFQQQLQRSQNQAYNLAIQRNPNLAGAVGAGLNYANIGAMSDFASRDAALRRQRQQLYLQRRDTETERQIREKQMMEQQYGLAYQQAQADISNAIGQLGYGFSSMYASTEGAGLFGNTEKPKKKKGGGDGGTGDGTGDGTGGGTGG